MRSDNVITSDTFYHLQIKKRFPNQRYGELSIISGKVPQSRWSRDIGKERIQVNFVNEIPDADVCLSWVNRSGEFKGKLVIKPGKRMAQKNISRTHVCRD